MGMGVGVRSPIDQKNRPSWAILDPAIGRREMTLRFFLGGGPEGPKKSILGKKLFDKHHIWAYLQETLNFSCLSSFCPIYTSKRVTYILWNSQFSKWPPCWKKIDSTHSKISCPCMSVMLHFCQKGPWWSLQGVRYWAWVIWVHSRVEMEIKRRDEKSASELRKFTGILPILPYDIFFVANIACHFCI